MAAIFHDLVHFPADAYTAPELIGGRPTPAGDVHALGVLAAELLSGRALPVDGGLPQTGTDIDHVVARATHPHPAERPTVERLLEELRSAISPDSPAFRRDVRNPYKGLAAFRESDAGDFFGRGALTAELVEAVGASQLTLVVGPSGIGKSSVVRAGLLPALRAGGVAGAERWIITDMFPGARPFNELEAALERVALSPAAEQIEAVRTGAAGLADAVQRLLPDGAVLLLVVDQFEELFTQVTDEETRRQFLSMLTGVAVDETAPVRVVATLRADFYDRPLRYAEFGELAAKSAVAVHAPSNDELEEVIRGPASRVGAGVTDGLVAALVAGSEHQPGALPLLQHALTELFEAREADLLDIGPYQATGGLAGSIGRRAEQIFLGFSPEERQLAREVFLRLVTVDEETEDTRRRVRHTELEHLPAPEGTLERVLDAFGRHRLLVFDRDAATRGPTVEIAHEALLQHWDRLRGWIDEVRDDLLMRRRVEIATRDWVDSGAEASYLLGGGRLERAEAWRDGSGIHVTDEEDEFLAESRRVFDLARARRRRLRRRVTTALSVALALAIGLGAFAWIQRGIAARETISARVQDLTTQAQVAIEEDPDLAILLALEAFELSKQLGGGQVPGEVMAALQTTTQASRLIARLPFGRVAQAMSPDGRLLAVDHPVDRAQLVLLDTATFEEYSTITAQGPVSGIAFEPGNETIAVAYYDNYAEWSPDQLAALPGVSLYEAASRGWRGDLDVPCCYQTVAFSGDGEYLLLTGSDTEPAIIIDIRGNIVWTFPVPPEVADVDWVPGTNTVVVAMEDAVSFLSVPDMVETQRFDDWELVPSPWVKPHPNGEMVAFISDTTQEVRIWSSTDPAPVTVPVAGAQSAVFDEAGERLAMVGNSDEILVRSLRTGDTLALPGNGSGVWRAAFDPAGERLFATSLDGETLVWDVTSDGVPDLGNIQTAGDLFAVGPWLTGDEILVAGGTASGEAFFQSLSVGTGEAHEGLPRLATVGRRRPGVAADGALVSGLTPTSNEAVVLDVDTGGEVAKFDSCETVVGLDGSTKVAVLSAGPVPCEDGRSSRVVDLATRQVVIDLGADPSLAPPWASLGPAGTVSAGVVAVNRGYQRIELYDLAGGRLLGSVEGSVASFFPVFSADGEILVIGTQSPEMLIVDMVAVEAGTSATDALERLPTGHPTQLALSGQAHLVTTHVGQLVQLWHRASRERWFELPISTTNTAWAFFSESDRYLYYEDTNGLLRRLPLDPVELADLARSRVQRDFTVEECERFLYDADCSVFEEAG